MEGRVRKFEITKKIFVRKTDSRLLPDKSNGTYCSWSWKRWLIDLVIADAKSLPDTDTIRKAFVEHPKAAFA